MIGSLESLSELWLDGNLLNSLPDVRREKEGRRGGGGGGGGGGGVKEADFEFLYPKQEILPNLKVFPLKGSVMHYMVYVHTDRSSKGESDYLCISSIGYL